MRSLFNFNNANLTTLDITDFKQKGDKLKEAILEAVEDTQRLIIRTLPDELVMTKEQYDDLEHDSSMVEQGVKGERIYVTSKNAMEVRVK